VVQSARAAVEQARLDLQRTIISAPFDAHVLSREVSVGSQVSASDPLARLAGVDRYWIETTIPPEKLRWLTFPDNGAQDGSRVSIRQRTAWNADQFRSGTLYRLIGELEGNTRLARALVAVDDPLARNTEDPDVPALMIGTYVECLIEGREIRDAFMLRREFVRKDV
jgi:multidrug efflux pump subunit AcrA (membrane-fusion protein)